MGVAVANLAAVLTALGQVAVTVDRADTAVSEAGSAFDSAMAALTEAMAGSNAAEAAEALAHMTIAITTTTDVDELLRAIADKVSTIVSRLVNPDGAQTPSGAQAARAPVAGRAHPTHTPAPPPEERDYEWAAQVGQQLTTWQRGMTTQALVFDAAGQDWQVNSGVDAGLTAATKPVIEDMIATGEIAATDDPVANQAERTGVRQAVTHAETKAAAWAAANGKKLVDVVINRDIVCGQTYRPGDRQNPPGCAQVIAAILPRGHTMRVWRRGAATPLVITGHGRKG